MPFPRSFAARLAAVAALIGASSLPAYAVKELTAVLESEVVFLDPHFTTANITRTFNYMVYDTLFSMDSKGTIQPQMVGDYTIAEDKLEYRFTLRDGLRWHDGAPVTAADCVASLKRWGSRDVLGRMLMKATQTLEALDGRTFVLKLEAPFPMLLEILGKPNAIVPFIIPERQANAPADQKITDVIGSGPFVFRRDLWRQGDTMVLERNPAYVPRAETPDFLAGGKLVKIDRLTLKTIPDAGTAAAALIAREIDYLQYVPFDWIARLERETSIRVMALGGIDMFEGNYRLNSAIAPFDDPAIRRVLWKLVDQASVLDAIGIPPNYRLENCASFWMCGTALETRVGSEVAHFSIEQARAELKKTRYAGDPVVFMQLSSITSGQAGLVMIDALKKAGFNVDAQVMDWATLLQRRAKKEGWNIFAVYSNGADMSSPLTHFYVANNCADYPGWSCDARITPLLADFVHADAAERRKAIAAQIQAYAYESTPAVMWGQFTVPAAYRTTLKDLIQSSFPIFWSVDMPDR